MKTDIWDIWTIYHYFFFLIFIDWRIKMFLDSCLVFHFDIKILMISL